MKNNQMVLPISLCAVLCVAFALQLVLPVWIPAIVLPPLNIPNMVLLCAVALCADALIAPKASRCYGLLALLAFGTFALLPYASGIAQEESLWKMGIAGAVVFTATTFLFTTLRDRAASGPRMVLVPFMGAIGLFLAAQCFAGMIL